MGNRSKYVAVTAAAAAAGVVSARRRSQLRQAAEAVRETIAPTHVVDLPTEFRLEDDESHAPGHRHLRRGRGEAPASKRRAHRVVTYAKGMRHRISDQ